MLPDWPRLILFLSAALILLVTPGPAVLYIIARSVDQGRGAGLISALGVGTGTFFHVVAAALGVSALLISSATAFATVKWLGAAYLVYLGVQKLRQGTPVIALDAPAPQPMANVFAQGIVVNILNPKTALFFFAFLPQFVDPAGSAIALQSLLLGTIFVVMGIFSDSLYALLAGSAGVWLRRSVWFWRSQRFVAGGVYIALGLTAAATGTHHK